MKVAYFSMEIGLNENMPTYSGGLGILAGDHIKSAADLNIPIVAVTLLYKRGYFIQNINPLGQQEEMYPYFDPRAFMEPLPFKVTIKIEGRDVHIGVWKYNQIGMHGRVPVYFLDTDLPINTADDRLITQFLYGGDQHTRICQEAVLGIGGYLALKKLERNITTYHMNEGHAVFLTLAMLRDANGNEESVREQCVFTTHTPVPAGHDRFSYGMAEKVLGAYLPANIRALAGKEELNTTVLALNLSRAANGVSELHGEISRQMFPGFNIGHITNGVHHLSWTGPEFQELFDRHLPNWRIQPQALSGARNIPDDEIREAKKKAKKRLISYINSVSGVGFTDEFLTICFARRAAAYKRATLLFTDLEYLFNLSFDRAQFIFAGKAHPQDGAGKELIKEIVNTGKQYEDKIRLVFLPNYNIWSAALMTQGTDVWLNTPRRPREASGTSGMKVCFNGGVNMSVLDGWWREGCRNRLNGWAIGDDEDQADEEAAADLYQDLDDMVTTYYSKPQQWLSIMKNSIADLTPVFNTHRMVLDYVHKYYI
ncbi:alpha-glucan family phosphorylase [Desulforhabdus amnigena]|jgi:starch phosphorylase|uniref:Alpha-glucan phosphorylase n=1 Tax=Desulforhabdus amnigena TaxID=40218 RepID=A0A9W6CWF8_9BACT|nr:alpha-glucan family phosphorylase [Desulforhabdus amnigena]NLJ26707.1 alpha-glucan family phosphorylase [Deltaproteobacteria bacterium]GLI33824.1 alpha-glucan phosphorylase [Desulforhabdus amnigena]